MLFICVNHLLLLKNLFWKVFYEHILILWWLYFIAGLLKPQWDYHCRLFRLYPSCKAYHWFFCVDVSTSTFIAAIVYMGSHRAVFKPSIFLSHRFSDLLELYRKLGSSLLEFRFQTCSASDEHSIHSSVMLIESMIESREFRCLLIISSPI